MQLNIIVDDYSMNLNLPEEFLKSSAESFERLDASMRDGIQMGREWVQQPDRQQRCQMAAGKLLTALATDHESLAMLSAGYIVSRMPDVRRVRIDNTGEPSATCFE